MKLESNGNNTDSHLHPLEGHLSNVLVSQSMRIASWALYLISHLAIQHFVLPASGQSLGGGLVDIIMTHKPSACSSTPG